APTSRARNAARVPAARRAARSNPSRRKELPRRADPARCTAPMPLPARHRLQRWPAHRAIRAMAAAARAPGWRRASSQPCAQPGRGSEPSARVELLELAVAQDLVFARLEERGDRLFLRL